MRGCSMCGSSVDSKVFSIKKVLRRPSSDRFAVTFSP